ncbi:MAG: hypothetical protein K0Q72_118 [Armatimonadetes bacterium]|jgi:hypothetical protein|nr:hypothetical protein [Armatimonadota bacterium]
MQLRLIAAASAAALMILPGAYAPLAQAGGDGRLAWVSTKDGRSLEGTLSADALSVSVDGTTKKVSLRELRSFHSADPATSEEAARITRGLTVLQGKDFKAAEAASADLTDIGLPVLSPLLAAYQDTDAHEPDPLYRLFGRIVPGFADAQDRKLDLVRLAGGVALRGKVAAQELKITGTDGKSTVLPAGSVRRLAVRQPTVERTFDLQALHHCTYVGWMDTGISVTPTTRLQADSAGYARLSFDEDGWASDPDGIADPLPGKRRLQEGFRWGAVLGRVGATGERWLAGKHIEKTGLGTGRLQIVINDNEHWQNNIGSYRVRLRATNAYDVGEPQ